MAYAAWLELRLDERSKRGTELPIEIAERPGGFQAWIDGLHLRKIGDDADEEEESYEIEIEDIPRWKREGWHKPNWVTRELPWYAAYAMKGHRSQGVTSNSRPHEEYGEVGTPDVIAGRQLDTPFNYDRLPDLLGHLRQSDFKAFRVGNRPARVDFTEKDPDDLEEILADFLGEEEPVEGEEVMVNPIFSGTATDELGDEAVAEPAKGPVPEFVLTDPSVAYEKQIEHLRETGPIEPEPLEPAHNRYTMLLGELLYGHWVELMGVQEVGQVVSYGQHVVTVQLEDETRVEWPMNDLVLCDPPTEVKGQQELPADEPEVIPYKMTNQELNRWKRSELPWLLEQIDKGYTLKAHAFNKLTEDQINVILAKRPGARGEES